MTVTAGNPCGTPLFSQLEHAKNGLEDAQIAYCGAVVTHAEFKRALELAEAHKLCEGVEGKNEKERAAKLRLELSAEYTVLYEAENALTEARCGLEVASAPSTDYLRVKPFKFKASV